MRIKSLLKWYSAFGILLFVMSHNVFADWYSAIGGKTKYNSNLTNGGVSSNIVNDTVFSLSGIAGKHFQLDDNDKLSIQSQFDGETYNRFTGMNNVSAGGTITLSRKWAMGLYSPWTSLSISGNYLNYNDKLRDGARYQVQLSNGKRFSEKWSVSTDIQFERRTAANDVEVDPGVSGGVYNLSSGTIKFNTVYAFTSQYSMNLGYQVRYGDVVSTAISHTPGSNIDTVMTAVSLDPTFGPNAEAYRLRGATHMFGACVSRLLTTHLIMNLEYQFLMTNAKGNNNYYVSLPALNVSYDF